MLSIYIVLGFIACYFIKLPAAENTGSKSKGIGWPRTCPQKLRWHSSLISRSPLSYHAGLVIIRLHLPPLCVAGYGYNHRPEVPADQDLKEVSSARMAHNFNLQGSPYLTRSLLDAAAVACLEALAQEAMQPSLHPK